jgi:hypothetical protein
MNTLNRLPLPESGKYDLQLTFITPGLNNYEVVNSNFSASNHSTAGKPIQLATTNSTVGN